VSALSETSFLYFKSISLPFSKFAKVEISSNERVKLIFLPFVDFEILVMVALSVCEVKETLSQLPAKLEYFTPTSADS